MFSLRTRADFDAQAVGTQNTKGKGEGEGGQGPSRAFLESWPVVIDTPLLTGRTCVRYKKLGSRALSASQWACWARVSTANNDKIVVHQ